MAWPVLRVDLKDPAFARWQKRTAPAPREPDDFLLVEAAAQALRGVSAAERAETGLVVALSAGCLVYSRRFFKASSARAAHGQPRAFSRDGFQFAGQPRGGGAGTERRGYALVGDETAWIAALQTAAVWLRRGACGRCSFSAWRSSIRSCSMLTAARAGSAARRSVPSKARPALLVRAARPEMRGDRRGA